MLVDAPRRGASSLAHERFLLVQRTGCSWMGCYPMRSRAIPSCATHRMIAEARGWGALPWAHERFLPVQRR
eukprot:6500328-Pyramimonas_sp.AAC.1